MDPTVAVWVTRLVWVVPPLLLLVFYKLALRVFGVIIIPEDSIGIVNKKFVLFGEQPDAARTARSSP